MAATIPQRTTDQRMTALEKGNRIRTYRARLKDDIRHGRRGALGVLIVPPEQAQTMKVFDLLMAMPHVGRVRANQVLRRANISPSKTLAGLTDRQRRELGALLP